MQEGSPARCAHRDCKRAVTYRIILGRWQVDVYTCTAHLKWGLDLDHTAESAGKALGWFYGYPTEWMTDYRGRRVPVGLRLRQPLVDLAARYSHARGRLPAVPRDAGTHLEVECTVHGPDDVLDHAICGACVRMGRAPKSEDRTDQTAVPV
jgi:hypothetical protein